MEGRRIRSGEERRIRGGGKDKKWEGRGEEDKRWRGRIRGRGGGGGEEDKRGRRKEGVGARGYEKGDRHTRKQMLKQQGR